MNNLSPKQRFGPIKMDYLDYFSPLLLLFAVSVCPSSPPPSPQILLPFHRFFPPGQLSGLGEEENFLYFYTHRNRKKEEDIRHFYFWLICARIFIIFSKIKENKIFQIHSFHLIDWPHFLPQYVHFPRINPMFGHCFAAAFAHYAVGSECPVSPIFGSFLWVLFTLWLCKFRTTNKETRGTSPTVGASMGWVNDKLFWRLTEGLICDWGPKKYANA